MWIGNIGQHLYHNKYYVPYDKNELIGTIFFHTGINLYENINLCICIYVHMYVISVFVKLLIKQNMHFHHFCSK